MEHGSAQHAFKNRPATVHRDEVVVGGTGGITDKTISKVVLPSSCLKHRCEHIRGMEP